MTWRPHLPRARRLRLITILFFLALTAVGLAIPTGTGTLCAMGLDGIAAICPLGNLEVMLASRTLLPRALLALGGIALIGMVAGKIFCAWMCPVPMVRNWILGAPKTTAPTGAGKRHGEPSGATGPADEAITASGVTVEPSHFHPARGPQKISLDSRHWVLGGALLSTAIFGLPVFCLICPVGLIFASLIAIWRLVQFNEPSWSLLLFPAILILEIALCRRWCHRLCPLGALLSLLGGLNFFTRPRVDPARCLRVIDGKNCVFCKNACPEAIDLHHHASSPPLSECTKCRECADACPAKAITFHF